MRGDLVDIRGVGDAHLDNTLLVVELEEVVVRAQVIQRRCNLVLVFGHESRPSTTPRRFVKYSDFFRRIQAEHQ